MTSRPREDEPGPDAPPRTVRRSAGIAMVGRFANAAIALVVGVVIARKLGPEGRASYAIAATVATGAYAMTNLALDSGVFWAVSERRASVHQVLRAIVRPLSIALVASLACFTIGALTLLRGQSIGVCLAAATALPALLAVLTLTSILYVTGDARTPTIGLVSVGVTQLAGITLLAGFGTLDPLRVLLVSTLAQVAGLVPMARAVRRIPRGVDGQPIGRWEIVRVGIELQPGTFALWLTMRADVIVVSQMASRRDLGLYSLAITLSETMLLSTDAIAAAALGRQAAGERASTARRSGELSTLCGLIAAVEMVGLVALGAPALRIGFGTRWNGTLPIAIALGVGVIAAAYTKPLTAAFVRSDRRRTLSKIVMCGAAVNIALALALVPAVGAVGAGVGSSCASILMAVIAGRLARRDMGVPLWIPPARLAAILERSR